MLQQQGKTLMSATEETTGWPAQFWARLGAAHLGVGDWRAARAALQKSLAMDRRIHGSGPDDTTAVHPDIATTLGALGTVCRSEGAYAAARAFYEQSLAMQRRIHGSGPDDTTAVHPHIALTLHMLGSLFVREGDLRAAEILLCRAHWMHVRTTSDAHPSSATMRDSLAHAREQTKSDRGRRLLRLFKDRSAGAAGAMCHWCCAMPQVALRKCGRCRVARYCGGECQAAHWRAGAWCRAVLDYGLVGFVAPFSFALLCLFGHAVSKVRWACRRRRFRRRACVIVDESDRSVVAFEILWPSLAPPSPFPIHIRRRHDDCVRGRSSVECCHGSGLID